MSDDAGRRYDRRRQPREANWKSILGRNLDGPEVHPTTELKRTGCPDNFATAHTVQVRCVDIHADNSVAFIAGEHAANRTK